MEKVYRIADIIWKVYVLTIVYTFGVLLWCLTLGSGLRIAKEMNSQEEEG